MQGIRLVIEDTGRTNRDRSRGHPTESGLEENSMETRLFVFLLYVNTASSGWLVSTGKSFCSPGTV